MSKTWREVIWFLSMMLYCALWVLAVYFSQWLWVVEAIGVFTFGLMMTLLLRIDVVKHTWQEQLIKRAIEAGKAQGLYMGLPGQEYERRDYVRLFGCQPSAKFGRIKALRLLQIPLPAGCNLATRVYNDGEYITLTAAREFVEVYWAKGLS
jgi:hypothetical protein